MTGTTTAAPRQPSWIQKHLTTQNVLPAVTLLALLVTLQTLNPAFLSYQGFITLVYSMSYFLIVALGLTFVIMMGSFDFSVVSIMKLSAILCVLYVNQLGLWVIPLVLLVCVAFGAINGFLFAKLKVPSFMATLGVSIVVEGIALLLSRGFLHMMRDDSFRALAVSFIWGLPAIFYWAIGIWIICTLVALLTPFGRRTYAIGGNPHAAAVSGINVDRHRIYVFMLSAFLSGVAGVLYMAQLGGGSVTIAGHMIIPLFASVVAGGTPLSGGAGGPHRTLFGVLIITWMQSGLLMLRTGRGLQVVVLGIIAIVMTIATADRSKLRQAIVK